MVLSFSSHLIFTAEKIYREALVELLKIGTLLSLAPNAAPTAADTVD